MSEISSKNQKLGDVEAELWRKSAPNFLTLFRTMFDNKIDTDVTVKVGFGSQSKEIECHSLVLSAHSSVLRAILNKEWIGDKRGNRRTVTLRDDDPVSFTYFLNMMYWDWNEENFNNYNIPEDFTPELTVGVFSLAHKYLACHIIRQAEHLIHCYLSKKMTPDMVKLYLLLKKLPICRTGQIAGKSLRTVENCLFADGENLFSSNAILQFHLPDLVDIVQDSFLRCKEKNVFNGCLRWGLEQCKQKRLAANRENIRSVLRDAINCIRFPLLDKLTITDEVVPAKILTEEEIVELLAYVVKKDLGVVENPIRFSIENRISFNVTPINRLGVDVVSKDLVDFSSLHGFEMSFSKEIMLDGIGFFVGNSTSKTYKIHTEIEVLNQQFDFHRNSKGSKITNTVCVKITPAIQILANIPVIVKFTITGGDTFVTDELVDEVTEEITYLDNEVMTVTFKSSPNIANGLQQIPSIWFSSTGSE